MGVLVNKISLSKNVLETEESFTISVRALDITKESVAYRLSFKLGVPHGHPVAQIAPKPITRISKLPVRMGAFKEEKVNG